MEINGRVEESSGSDNQRDNDKDGFSYDKKVICHYRGKECTVMKTWYH